MKLAGAVSLAAVALDLAAAPAVAAPLPTAWQPVVSNNPAAIGRFVTISQPANVTGVFTALPTTHLPRAGTGTLSWSASSDTLSWRGGPAVSVNSAASATYSLPEPATGSSTPPTVLVAVTAGQLPSVDASDSLTVTSAPATAGFGDRFRDTARGSAMFMGNLYLGLEVSQPSHVGEVWRTANGVTWVEAAPVSFGQGSAIKHVDSFIVYDGQLYAGTDSGQIWRTSDGTLWTLAAVTPGYSENITGFAIFGARLYANQANAGSPAGVFSSTDGTSWNNMFNFTEPQEEYTHDLQVFDGSLYSELGSYKGYLGPGGGEIASSNNGSTWQLTGGDGFGDASNTDVSGFAIFGSNLYAGTFNSAEGAQVWRTSDGTAWQNVDTAGFGDAQNTVVHELTVFDNELYAGTEDDTEGGEIFRTADGMHWSLANLPGFGQPNTEVQRIRSFFQLGGYLYANAENDCEGAPATCQENGWELWRLR